MTTKNELIKRARDSFDTVRDMKGASIDPNVPVVRKALIEGIKDDLRAAGLDLNDDKTYGDVFGADVSKKQFDILTP